jgi:hypothetical protein
MKKTTTALFAVGTVVVLGLLLLVYMQSLGTTTGTATTTLTIETKGATGTINPGNTTTWTYSNGAWTSTTHVSAGGNTTYVFEGLTVKSNCYDQLITASNIAGFDVVSDNQTLGLIVTGIDGIANQGNTHDNWQYYVNGVYANKGCAVYALNDGDKVEWKFTSNQYNSG